MEINKKTPAGTQGDIKQSEDTKSQTQIQVVYEYLHNHIATASMVSEATGIYQKNICRYKRLLEKSGQLWEVFKDTCKTTGFKANYITMNPDLIQEPKVKQLELF